MNGKRCTLLYLRRGDEILLAMKKRGFGTGYYNGVGGKIEPGETIEQATIRECEEEIGVTPLSLTPVAEHDFYEENDRFSIHAYVFFCDKWQGEPKETDEMAPRWFHKGELPYDKMWAGDTLWLPLLIEGKKIHGELYFDKDDQVVSHTLNEKELLPHEQETRT